MPGLAISEKLIRVPSVIHKKPPILVIELPVNDCRVDGHILGVL